MATNDTFSFFSSRGPLGPADYRRAAERLGGVIDRLPCHDSTAFLLRDVAGLLDHAADALPQPAHPWDGKSLEELLEIAIDCGWSPMLGRTLDRGREPRWLVSMGDGKRAHVNAKENNPRAAVLAAMKQLEQEIRK